MRATRIVGPPEDRFWPKVDKAGPVPEHRPDLGPCWLWTAAQNSAGYGILRLVPGPGGRNVRAHRYAYELLIGPIPAGLQLDHLCRVRHCVRPKHLEPVTNRENGQRGLPGGRAWRRQRTHCKNGHEFTERTTFIKKNGQRVCRVCRNDALRRWREKQRARGV